MSRRDAFDCFCLRVLVHNYHHTLRFYQDEGERTSQWGQVCDTSTETRTLGKDPR